VGSAIINLAFPVGTFVENAPPPSVAPLTLVLTGDISPSATAKNIALSLDTSGSVSATDKSNAFPVGNQTQGDPTGFPMVSGLLTLEPADISKTYGNYPNPFRSGVENTTIEFYLPQASTVSLVMYDVLGSKVKTFVNGESLSAGLQRYPWDGRNGSGSQVLSGVYYAQLTVNGTSYLLKVAVVK
jgi:hypothetical protein